ncbi:NACHT domain-containing protein [Myxococcus eversor]|uniref:NACHT domain-containing protein n=1 Tax=Myxococcus eversor TaxID=2709661 RepID=UPI0013CF9DC2|nr:hypothetical protein [Myxococcus eversor]
MHTPIDAVARLLHIDRTLQHGEDWLYGDTFGIDRRRYLIILTNTENLTSRITEELSKINRRTSRALARAANTEIPGSVLDSHIHKTIIIKTSPGPVNTITLDDETNPDWQALHLNDLLSEQILNLRLSQIPQHIKSQPLPSPIGELTTIKPSNFIDPEFTETAPPTSHLAPPSATQAIADWSIAVEAPPFLTIFGIGGIGKSTLLKLAGAKLWQGFLDYQHSTIPVYVPMRGIPAGADIDLAAHINSFPLFKSRTTAAAVEELIASGLLTVFLDAFDEHLKFSNRSDAVRFLKKLRASYAPPEKQRASKIILTSRDYYLTTDKIFNDELDGLARKITLKPFNRDQRRRFIGISVGHVLSTEQVDNWCNALEQVAGGVSGGDYLVGHSLFLHAFSNYITGITPKGTDTTLPVQSPEDFANIQSSRLFDQVIDLINQREYQEKSNWGTELYGRLKNNWHKSPFTPENQRRFFSEIARLILQEKRYYTRPPQEESIKGILIERQTHYALQASFGIPQADPELDPGVKDQIENEALQCIANFLNHHPLTQGTQTGFNGSHFAYQHPAYNDYFIKEYLTIRFSELASKLNQKDTTHSALADIVVTLVTELIVTEVEERATNALFFLCWDNQSISHLSSALERLFSQPTKIGGEEFSYLLTYALVFVRLYRDIRELPVNLRNLCFDNGKDDDLILLDGQSLNRYLSDLSLSLCTFGNLQLKNTLCRNCDFLHISVRSLALSGTVEFHGGHLYLVSDDERGAQALAEAMYPTGVQTKIILKDVKIHKETWDALQILAQRYSNVSIVHDNIIITDFEEEQNSSESAAKRLANQLMRLVRKDRRGEFGVYKHKLFGRTAVPSAKTSAVETFLIEQGIVELRGDIFIIPDDSIMYHPDGLYGRLFSEVADYWKPRIEKLEGILQF